MKILIAGSHGMVGSIVTERLLEHGHEIVRLVRTQPSAGEVWWNPDAGVIDASGLEGFDAVINLATAPWPFRWTSRAKAKIRRNRRSTYQLLADALAGCTRKPSVIVCASGIGVYPPSGDEIITEETPVVETFLSAVDRDGEAATSLAEAAGIRVVHLRIPPVVGGAALQRIGFSAGDGQQWNTWVSREELASIVEFALTCETLSGVVNAVSPMPLRGAEFAATATKALGQKPGGTMPALIVRLVFGEMGQEFMLASRRVQPAKLLAAGYRFRYPELACALQREREVVNAASPSSVVAQQPAIHP